MSKTFRSRKNKWDDEVNEQSAAKAKRNKKFRKVRREKEEYFDEFARENLEVDRRG
jgi:hypothetical protein